MTTVATRFPQRDRPGERVGDRLVRRAGAAARLARRHWLLLLLLLAGGVLRLLVIRAYSPGFWFHGDSGTYLRLAVTHEPGVIRPNGYSFFLSLLQWLHSVRAITALQHLMGWGLAVAVYALLRRRDVSRPVSALAVSPMLLDARTVALEHFVLAETLFTFLITIGIIALCWRPTPGWAACLVAAGTFAAAAVTRSIGLMALGVPLLYLLLRRVPARRTAAFVAVVAVTLGGYLAWYHQHHGRYAFGAYGPRFLWARTTTFVDCDRLQLSDAERRLCPAEPRDRRLQPDVYLWTRSPYRVTRGDPHGATYASFARKAILAQPLDYAATVAGDVGWTLRPGYPNDRVECLHRMWRLPGVGDGPCQPYRAPYDSAHPKRGPLVGKTVSPTSAALHTYSTVAVAPPLLTALCFLLAVALAAYRPRACGRRAHLDPLAWTGLALGMIVVSIATSALDPRYTVPSLPPAVIGAALAWQRFQAARRAALPTARAAVRPARRSAARWAGRAAGAGAPPQPPPPGC